MIDGGTRSWKAVSIVLAISLTVALAWIAYPHVRAIAIPPELTPAARGRQLAEDLGCFTCHGPLGRAGVSNPGSQYKAVPPFHEGTIMMFAKSDQDLREYILDGAPASKRESAEYLQEMSEQAIRMPAYRDHVSAQDVEDLVAFLRATSELLYPPDGPASDGEELARDLGCFTCHGAMGGGGHANPGSLKGYIPGFYGPDYAELVQNKDELRSWIENGGIGRLTDDPLAAYFLERQRVQMPAYGGFLSEKQIDDVIAYVEWLSTETWRELPLQE
jgi:mono/diheme cytochrome c family protein